MPYYKDLANCDYFNWPSLVAVGWLKMGHPFTVGPLPRPFEEKLSRLLQWPIQDPFRYIMFGRHFCEFCEDRSARTVTFWERQIEIGRKNLFVPGPAGSVFVAPSTIAHYIVEHGYCPPLEFQTAVLACPPMWSPAYFWQMQKRGVAIWSPLTFLKNIHHFGFL